MVEETWKMAKEDTNMRDVVIDRFNISLTRLDLKRVQWQYLLTINALSTMPLLQGTQSSYLAGSMMRL